MSSEFRGGGGGELVMEVRELLGGLETCSVRSKFKHIQAAGAESSTVRCRLNQHFQ